MATRKNDYQTLTTELQAIIDWFESGQVDIDEAVVKYQKALELIKQIETYLKTTENKIQKINKNFGS